MASPAANKLVEKIRASKSAATPFFQVMAECEAFFASDNNLLRRADGTTIQLREIPFAPGWKNRYVFNQLSTRAEREISAFTALFPSYQCDPNPPPGSNSAEVASQQSTRAALAAERQLDHFYNDLHMAEIDDDLKRGCVVLGEMYAWPDIDWSQGDELMGTGVDGGPNKRTGKVCVRVLDPTQVVWEQGKSFKESAWVAIECFYTQAEASARWPHIWPNPEDVTTDSVAQGTLSGAILDNNRTTRTPNLLSVWHYFERPSPTKPKGQKRVVAGDHDLEEGDYPYLFEETDNEPWVVQFTYRPQPRRSRAQSFLQNLLDPQRSYDRRHQIEAEFANMAIPMWNVPATMAQQQEIKIAPGEQHRVTPGVDSGVQPVNLPQVPTGLIDAPQRISNEMDGISGQFDPTNLAASAAAQSIQQIVQINQARQGAIARRFDSAHAKLAIRMLLLASKYYTEPRTISYRSGSGAQKLEGFVASREMPRPINITVKSGTPRAPGEVQATATQWATLPNFNLSPARVMLAIENNDLSEITGTFKLDKERQERRNDAIFHLDPKKLRPMIQEFASIAAAKQNELSAQGVPFDLSQASPPPGPWPHADPHDNEDICIAVLTDWMKTPEYESMPRENQQIAQWLLQELNMQKAAKEQQQAQLQAVLAQQQGAQNASLPNQGTPMPSQASLQSNTPESVNSAPVAA